MPTKFVPNRSFEAELKHSSQMQTVMTDAAEGVAEVVRQIGPKDSDDPEKYGHYVDDITVASGFDATHGSVVGRVNANKFTSSWIEVGNIKIHAMAPLRRALDTLGLKYTSKRGHA